MKYILRNKTMEDKGFTDYSLPFETEEEALKELNERIKVDSELGIHDEWYVDDMYDEVNYDEFCDETNYEEEFNAWKLERFENAVNEGRFE